MSKKNATGFLVFVLFIMCVSSTAAESVFVYKKPKESHPGKEVTPLEAYALIKQDPAHMVIIDVRTRPEYQYVGHPEGAFLVPLLFWSNEFKNGKYQLKENPNFTKDVMGRFNPKTDTLFFLCRSGHRAARALSATVKEGWPAEMAYVILGGFEGEKLKDENSAFHGQRIGGGWRTEGLPWSYDMEEKLIY